jgi:hypothetical protein
VAALLLLGAPQLAAGQATSRIAVVGSDSPTREIQLLRDSEEVLIGKTSLLLRNSSTEAATISVRYFPDSGGAVDLTATTRPLALNEAARVPAGAVAVLSLRAAVDPTNQPSDLDGTLLISASGAGGTGARPDLGSVEVRVKGTLGRPTGVSFEPESVALQVTDAVWFSDTRGDRTTVRLRGPGVARLLAQYSGISATGRELPPAATVLLSNDSGHQARIELRNLKGLAPDLAEVTLRTQGTPAAGAYEGTLPLAPGTTGGPTLGVKVRSQDWFPIAALLVLAGSLLGGLLPQVTATARRKAVLRRELRALLAEFDKERGDITLASAAWNIEEDTLGKRPWINQNWHGLPGDEGVAALWTNIRRARSADDLKDDEARAVAIRASIRRWLRIERVARELRIVKDSLPADRDDLWRRTKVRSRTEAVLVEARSGEPADDRSAAQLEQRIERQTFIHTRFALAWTQKADLRKRLSVELQEQNQKLWDAADLEKLDDSLGLDPDDGPWLEPKGFGTRLDDALKAVDDLWGLVPENGELVQVGAGAAVAVGDVAHDAAREESGPPPPPSVVQAPIPAAEIAPPAVPDADRTRLALVGTISSQGRRAGRATWRILAAADWGITIAIAVVTVVAYMLPLYTGSWGTWQDWLTAFAAGFLGQVAIKWALMPIFQSRRIRVPAPGAATRATSA